MLTCCWAACPCKEGREAGMATRLRRSRGPVRAGGVQQSQCVTAVQRVPWRLPVQSHIATSYRIAVLHTVAGWKANGHEIYVARTERVYGGAGISA